MKFKTQIVLLFIVVLSACKPTKNVIDASKTAKKMSSKKIIRKHLAVHFERETIDAKFKVHYQDKKTGLGFSVRMKIKKDEVIWLKGTKLITLFKAKITPTSVRYYSSVKKNYFEGDFSMIQQLLGVEINFEQLQNLFLGQAILDLKKEKQVVEIKDNAHVLSPKVQSALFDVFFFVNPSHFKLDKQSVVNTEKELQLDILYPRYKVIDKEVYPEDIHIRVHQKNALTKIDFSLKSVVFDTEINTSYRVPSSYKKITL